MKRIAFYISPDKAAAYQWAEFTAEKLKELGAECGAPSEMIKNFKKENLEFVKPVPYEEFEKFADVVISFGGDGSMLSAARTLIKTNVPIMGVNVGNLGFLAEFSVKDLEKSLKDLVEGNYRVVDRVVIETVIDNETIYALNDVVIEKKDSSRMITVSAYANDKFIADYRADGLLLTTPAGSTAYNLSCGGPIISPSTPVFCITPISPHSLTHRPLVIDDTSEIKLTVYSPTGYCNFVADGQHEKQLANNDSILFKKSEEKIKLIKPLKTTYYDLLRAKLLWAANTVRKKDQ